MARVRSNKAAFSLDDSLFGAKPRKAIPHEFVLEAVSSLSPFTRPMFGCIAVYVGEKIVFALRDKPDSPADNGVWLATTAEHHESLRRELPTMRSIQVFGKEVTGWQVLPTEAADFEESALRACELVIAGDQRIGKVPGAKQPSTSKKKSSSTEQKTARKSAPRKAKRGR